MGRLRLWLLLSLACGIASCPGCTNSATPPSSASDEAKKREVSRQAEMNFRTDQINRSNLPPEQKKRMLEQIRGGEQK